MYITRSDAVCILVYRMHACSKVSCRFLSHPRGILVMVRGPVLRGMHESGLDDMRGEGDIAGLIMSMELKASCWS